MINVLALIQVRAFARQDGFFLFLVWAASFLAVVNAPTSSWGSLLALSTPFFVGWRLVSFRNYALDGVISFRRALVYTFYTFFYASLLFAVAQFIYFRFFDGGQLIASVKGAIDQLAPAYEASGISVGQLQQSIDAIASLTPIELSFIFMMQNFFFGIILSFPIAAVCQRSKPNNYLR